MILIVDDDPVDRLIFRQSLDVASPGGFTFEEVDSGRAGIAALERFHPDCVLLDFHLPDLDGLQVIRTLHKRQDSLPCAVVMLTGTGSEQIAVEAMKLGVMDYLAKGPESAQALSRTVASAVQRFRLQLQIEQQRQALEQRNRELEEIRAELFDEKERYRTLAESIPQLVWTADSEGRVNYANQRLLEFSGREKDAENWPVAGLVHMEDRAGLRECWAQAARSRTPFETDVRLHRASDGTWRWHLMRAVPMLSVEDGAVRWFGTFTDVEDQRRAEEMARQRQKLESIGLLAGGIAHDFNNLLVGIMGGASFAMDSLDPDHPAYPMLEIVSRSSERAANLTRQLLAYSGKAQAILEPVDIARLAKKTVEQLRSTIPNGITLVIENERDVPRIQADTGQMEQLIANLVMNAVEAIEGNQGRIHICTAVERLAGAKCRANVPVDSLPPGRYLLLEISDTGCGMDEETVAQIFDPFFTTKFTGRGLGLAAVHGIVRTLGGGIQVTSKVGKGSTFRVLFPLKAAIGDRCVILIIGGSEKEESALRLAGYDVLSCANGSQCTEVFASNQDPVDLVILNADKPGWRETFARVRGVTSQIPLAILASNTEDAAARGLAGMGMVEIIGKPGLIEKSVDRILGRTPKMTAVCGSGRNKEDGATT